MPSKKERLEFLEAECETHRESLKELFEENKSLKQELNELKKKDGNTQLTPTINPVNLPSVWPWTMSGYCPKCGQYFSGSHLCIKESWTCKTGEPR